MFRQNVVNIAIGCRRPRGYKKCIVYDGRHDVNVLSQHGGLVVGERGASFMARQRLDGVVVEFGKREVHN